MAFEFHLPDIGEGVIEGEIVAWKVAEGDTVALDQPMVEIMTDKATVEIPSPRAGRIAKINYQAGQICPVGKVLVVIEDGAAKGNGHGQAKKEPAKAAPRVEVIDATPRTGGERVRATPATRKLARTMGVELGQVTPTGKHGRVTSEDVKNFRGRASTPGPLRWPSAQPERAIAIPRTELEERVPLRGMRRKIAEAMSRSVHTAAHFTYVEEVDVTDLVALRARAKERAEERGVRLTFLPFIVKAVVAGLKKWPQLNAALDETTQEIVRKRYYHIGIAAQGPQGLVVSVIRDADKRSIFDLASEIERLGKAVQDGTATRDDLTGSTFTISSLGKLGGVLATPIINFPEVGIIGVHKIAEKPAVVNGQIAIRSLMNLSISVDHRLADGWDGAMLLQDVKTLLEDPTLMFMEMV
ncbi:MAG TPA: dihydrolipoamide acetyltransferase family protein [Kofleriaceae bacterium]|nr:dihydrolipoamide acetyltransferase family protein [Kofleriaceae bacterium]